MNYLPDECRAPCYLPINQRIIEILHSPHRSSLGRAIAKHEAKVDEYRSFRKRKEEYETEIGTGSGPAAAALKKRPTDATHLSKGIKAVFPSAWVGRAIQEVATAAYGCSEMSAWGPELTSVSSHGEGVRPPCTLEAVCRAGNHVKLEGCPGVQEGGLSSPGTPAFAGPSSRKRFRELGP